MHFIRLRKPWEKIDPATSQRRRIDVPEPVDVDQPESPAAAADYERRFNRPSGLGAGTSVRLRIHEWSGELTSLTINDQPLPLGPAPLEVDLTDQLQPHNRLQLTLTTTGQSTARLSGEVTLAIDD